MQEHAEERAIKVATRRAIVALFDLWRAFIEIRLARRWHRKPTNNQVQMELRSIPVDDTISLILEPLRRLERRLGRPARDWTKDEKRMAALLLEETFRSCLSEMKRGRGRPRRKRLGLLESEMTFDPNCAPWHEMGEDLDKMYEKFERMKKLKAFMVAEGHPEIDDEQGALDYVKSFTRLRLEDELPTRAPPGTLDEFRAVLGIEPAYKNALKMRLSRGRRKS